ncbi:MAG: hypothetical protein V4655_07445 [Bdellovibrionota bacterium]
MFGIGPMEAIIIALIAIIFVGPDKLPGVLKKFGRFYVQAKRHANDVKSGFDQAIHQAERDLELERIRELQREIQATTNLANIIDADHSDSSKPALNAPDHTDPTHTADGRLIQPPPAQSQSAMPPDEVEQTTREAYHEGHLPPQNRDEDHDPFKADALKNKDLHEEKKV